jgi:signal transduction histidine kinase
VRKRAEPAPRHRHEELVRRLAARTNELTRVNEQLHAEVLERHRAETIREEQRQLSLFSAELHATILGEGTCSDMLQQCAAVLLRKLDAAFVRIWLLGPGDLCESCYKAADCTNRAQCLHLAASEGLSRNLNGEYRRVPLDALEIGRIAQGKGAMFTNDVLKDDLLPDKAWLQAQGLQSFAGQPLMMGNRVQGVAAVFARHPLTETKLAAFETAAKTLSLGIERKQAEEALRAQQSELETLAARLLTAQEQERQRIARELHDDVSQRLAALVLDVAALENQPPILPELVPGRLQPVREQLEQLSDDIHRLAYRLHPSTLEHIGIEIAMKEHIGDFSKRSRLPVRFLPREIPDKLPLDVSTTLFRVLQECLSNVAKHAKSSAVVVKLSGSSHGIGLSVADNGKGLDMDKVALARRRGLGLVSMEERLRQLKGSLRVHSRSANGTKVCAWVPFRGQSDE